MKIITPFLVALITFVSVQGATSAKPKKTKDLLELSDVFKGINTPSTVNIENLKIHLKTICALNRKDAQEFFSLITPEYVKAIGALPPELRKMACSCKNLDEAIAATPKGSLARQFRVATCGSEGKPNAASRNGENSMIFTLVISMLMVNAAYNLL